MEESAWSLAGRRASLFAQFSKLFMNVDAEFREKV